MKQQFKEVLRWTMVCLIFIGMLLLLFSALSFPLDVHKPLYYVALGFFTVVALTIVIGQIVSHKKSKKLTKKEEEALLYMSKHETYFIKASSFSSLFGQDVYLNLLRKGYIEVHLIEGVQEVHCTLSKVGHDYVLNQKQNIYEE